MLKALPLLSKPKMYFIGLGATMIAPLRFVNYRLPRERRHIIEAS
jgi:hypothetical protein